MTHTQNGSILRQLCFDSESRCPADFFFLKLALVAHPNRLAVEERTIAEVILKERIILEWTKTKSALLLGNYLKLFNFEETGFIALIARLF